jgi:hypothetical protein
LGDASGRFLAAGKEVEDKAAKKDRVRNFTYGLSTSGGTYETTERRASRLTEALRGLMKEEIQKQGGTEAFLRWIRSDEDAR